jgi:hypothetical protein
MNFCNIKRGILYEKDGGVKQNNKKIVILWVLGILAVFGYAYFGINEIPVYRSNISLISSQEIATVSIILIIFAVLSLILKDSINRSLNIIGGTVLGLGFLAALVDGMDVNLSGIYNVMMGVEVITMIIIIMFAYRMPKTQK